MKKKLPRSIRKYIRKEKARIRREVFDLKEQDSLISKIYEKLFKKPEVKKEESQKPKKEINKKETKKDKKEKNIKETPINKNDN